MRTLSILFLIVITPISLISEPNCNTYKMEGNQRCYEACILATLGGGSQGSRESQIKFDKALEQCPNLDYAYMEKSVPYLKRGDFVSWKLLIDKAVEINPMGHLGYRGWCRYQFLKDYKGAISDFETLDSLTEFDLGYSINGDYKLSIAKALCYKAIGEKEKAVEMIEKQLIEKAYSPMLYDYLHLGVLKMEIGDIEESIKYLRKSINHNDYLAEPYYYLGLIYKMQGKQKEFKENMEKAKSYYLKGYRVFDPYSNPIDKIYLCNIEENLDTVEAVN